ncbi:4-hydroxy-3-polyprenylbenzoate decarboxylase [Neisseria sp. HSC-16F19]|nr:flavin prenyltransferase UbiX [Neisseria sp. HSC-16F19]MCP2041473.1 4-hydroxy-3-polyprenylbenzoate decarboxylase [Neisseria sp. HSC-16F19]
MLYPISRPVHTVTLAFTGASGLPYGMRLLECLLKADKTVWLLYSQAAQIVAKQEMNLTLPAQAAQCADMLRARFQAAPHQLQVFGKDEWFAPPASGSNPADAMVVCPASMGVVASIAAGTSDHLIERAADVCIKEQRPLILVPRETPLSAIHLENMLKLARLGVCILPPAPGFYQHPATVDDMVDFVVARILDQLGIAHQLMPRWGE